MEWDLDHVILLLLLLLGLVEAPKKPLHIRVVILIRRGRVVTELCSELRRPQ